MKKKIKKVIKGLTKASKLHAKQAKILIENSKLDVVAATAFEEAATKVQEVLA